MDVFFVVALLFDDDNENNNNEDDDDEGKTLGHTDDIRPLENINYQKERSEDYEIYISHLLLSNESFNVFSIIIVIINISIIRWWWLIINFILNQKFFVLFILQKLRELYLLPLCL